VEAFAGKTICVQPFSGEKMVTAGTFEESVPEPEDCNNTEVENNQAEDKLFRCSEKQLDNPGIGEPAEKEGKQADSQSSDTDCSSQFLFCCRQ
jgi:hypothetical protein